MSRPKRILTQDAEEAYAELLMAIQTSKLTMQEKVLITSRLYVTLRKEKLGLEKSESQKT